MSFRAYLLAAVAALPVLPGCGSSRLDSFPEFPSHKARLGKSVINADFLVMRATGGDTSTVDLAANKATADTILRFVQGHLDAKGYNVSARLLSSVGLAMDSGFTANVSHTSELDREGEDRALSFHPPFYLYQPLRRDPVMTSYLGALYRKLTRMEESDSGYPSMPEAVPAGKAFGGGLMFILLGGGYEVSPGVEVVAGDSPGRVQNSPNPVIAVHQVSQTSLHLFVLDPGTGALLWTDRRVITGGMVYDDKFIRMAGLLLEDLP